MIEAEGDVGRPTFTWGARAMLFFHSEPDAEFVGEDIPILQTYALLAAHALGLGAVTLGVIPPVVDQVSEVRDALAPSEMWPASGWVARVFTFSHVRNTGIAFGMFQGRNEVMLLVALAVVAGVLWWRRGQARLCRGGFRNGCRGRRRRCRAAHGRGRSAVPR